MDLNYIVYILIGAIVGSFLNVVVSRLGTAESFVVGRSHCPKCKKTIRFLDLVPVLSYIFLWGRCRDCHERISYQYPLVESVCAIFFGLSYYLYGLSWLSILSAIFLTFMLVIVIYDFRELAIPEFVSWIALISVLALRVVIDYNNFTNIILGALVGGGIIALLVLISRGKWMGEGDIKVGTTIGIFLTFPIAIIGIFLAFFSGAVIGIILIALKIKGTKDPVPFTPFLLLGGLASMIYGQRILNWYLETVIF